MSPQQGGLKHAVPYYIIIRRMPVGKGFSLDELFYRLDDLFKNKAFPEFRVGTLVQGDVAIAEAERIWDELLKMEVGCFATLKAHDVSFTRLACQIVYLKSAYFTELMFVREECRTTTVERKVVGELTLDKVKDAIGDGIVIHRRILSAGKFLTIGGFTT